MALQPGDRVTLTLSPTIQLSRFISLKPFVSIQRVMSDDPEADLAALEATIREQYKRAVVREVEMMSATTEAVGKDADLDTLVEWCEQETADVTAEQAVEEEGEDEARPPHKAGKALKRKPRRRAK